MPTSDIENIHNFAKQLREPHGKQGVQVGALMHQSNFNMTKTCFSCMEISPDDFLLEVGHGNGAHVRHFFEKFPQIRYQGLELSWLMHHESMRFNQDLVSTGKARFTVYDGEKFPFSDRAFNKIMAVNTLDFLSDPLMFLIEAHRTLKVGGQFGMAFDSREFMRSLSFISPSIRLYGVKEVKQLMSSAGFVDLIEINVHEKTTVNNEFFGQEMRREFFVIIASKRDASSQSA